MSKYNFNDGLGVQREIVYLVKHEIMIYYPFWVIFSHIRTASTQRTVCITTDLFFQSYLDRSRFLFFFFLANHLYASLTTSSPFPCLIFLLQQNTIYLDEQKKK